MEYRTLGRSGCAVSSLCLGTMTFGVEADEPGAHEQLDRFTEAGGTFVDTADVYGDGRSEEIIGRWFASRPADVTEPVVLATQGRFPRGAGGAPRARRRSARRRGRGRAGRGGRPAPAGLRGPGGGGGRGGPRPPRARGGAGGRGRAQK